MPRPSSIHAFPVADPDYMQLGMTLRDYFAAAVLASLQPGARDNMDRRWWYAPEDVASRAYEIADAMLRHR